ncbi:MAG: glycosyltransferase [Kiritimatiellia bacterium]
MKLVFIDHACHRKTQSSGFFLEILRQAFQVAEHWYARHYATGAAAAVRARDLAVVWEFPVSRFRFFFPGKRNVFVPMYDNEWASFWQWKRIAWSGMGVVSFCAKVSAHARRCGVANLLDVRYFPDPAQLPQRPGDPRRVFLWERGEITREMAERLFPPAAGYTFDVKGASEFLPRAAYLARLAACGVVIAPRRKEGIGMAFLEAMAMGKCVVAWDDATMNEYVEDGVTGILFDGTRLQPVDPGRVEIVLRNMPERAAQFHRRWLADARTINGFLAAQSALRPSAAARAKILLAYPLFLLEGLVYRLAHRGGRRG